VSGSDEGKSHELVIIRRRKGEEEGGHHGGVWKIAYADFMTAMMAFFLVMWLINSTDKKTLTQVATYFNPLRLTDKRPSPKGLEEPDGNEGKDSAEQKGASKKDSAASQKGANKKDGDAKSKKKTEEAQPGEVRSRGRPFQREVEDREQKTPGDVGATPGESPRQAGGRAYRDPFDSVHRSEIIPTDPSSGKVGPATPPRVAQGAERAAPPAAGPSIADGGRTAPPAAGPSIADAGRTAPPVAAPPIADAGRTVPPAAGPSIADGGRTAPPAASPSIADAGRTTPPAAGPSIADGGRTAPPAAGPSIADAGRATPPAGPSTAAGRDAASEPKAAPPPQAPSKEASDRADAAQLEAAIRQAIAESLAGSVPNIDVVATPDGVLISLTDDYEFGMFAIASADPRPAMIVVMDKLGKILLARPEPLVIRGHTDRRPYRTAAYDNWRLSAARAHMAYVMLARSGVDEKRFERIDRKSVV